MGAEKLWRSLPSNQLAILRHRLEPMLQSELQYCGLATGSYGFEAKLMGWVEVTED
jgi:hypothetical protein